MVYMTDYINDLKAQGLSEPEAFAKAKEALASQETDQYADMNARIQEYYLNVDPAEHEIVGLVYGGLTIVGLVAGAFIGYLTSGGRSEFISGGWIDTLIGAGVGMMVCVGLALIINANIVYNGRK